MGVYVFVSRHAPYIKIGHYARSDPWDRVARRGFYSCVSPRELHQLRSAQDVDLVAWFARLTTRSERKAHRFCREMSAAALRNNRVVPIESKGNVVVSRPLRCCVGEWHDAALLPAVLELLEKEEEKERVTPDRETEESKTRKGKKMTKERVDRSLQDFPDFSFRADDEVQ